MDTSNGYCKVIKTCPFFNQLFFSSTAETLKVLFCKSDWEKCARWKMRTSGQEVPLEMWPNGALNP